MKSSHWNLGIGFAVFLALLIWWNSNQKNKRLEATSEVASVEEEWEPFDEEEQVSTSLAVAEVEPSEEEPPEPDEPTMTEVENPSSSEADPETEDRFKLRKLDIPLPSSLNDLLSRLTRYRIPRLPEAFPGQGRSLDGNVLKLYRGYYEDASGGFRRVQIVRDTGGVALAIERASGRLYEGASVSGELRLRNFNGDPYSLVIVVPNRRILYLKFHSQVLIPGEEDRSDAMVGWMVSRSGQIETVSSMALVNHVDFELVQNSHHQRPAEGSYPSPDLIKKLLPKPLSQGTDGHL